MNQHDNQIARTHRQRPSRAASGYASLLVAFCGMLAVALSACGERTSTERKSSAAETPNSNGVTSSDRRIVTLGGGVTEIVHHLGHGDDVIAVDITSTYPASVKELPQVGYLRTLSAESIIALDPTLVIASADAKPSAALEQIERVGIRVVIIPESPTVEGIRDRIVSIAAALEEPERGARVADSVVTALNAVAAGDDTAGAPSILFVYARGSGSIHAAGTGTPADLMIRLSGGRNAVTSYEGFRPLTAEGIAEIDPDIVLLPRSGAESLGGVDGIVATPGMSRTSAGRHRRVIVMDDLFLIGLGPRAADAVAQLRREAVRMMGMVATR